MGSFRKKRLIFRIRKFLGIKRRPKYAKLMKPQAILWESEVR